MLTVVAMLTLQVTTGGLLTQLEPRGVSLLAQAPLPGEFQRKSASELNLELTALTEALPSLGGPIAMLVTGGVLGVGGLGAAYFGLLVLVLGANAALLVGGLIAAALGVALVVVGAVLLSSNRRQRRAISRDIEAVRSELRALEHEPEYAPPTLPLPLPRVPGELSAPPLPPQALGPTPTVLLARF
jgi:hypothetical protein